ncbi:MAG: glycosyltransferase family 39 protein, partial [Caldilineales bacterium]|nr:glycosyltransferase family 39 protein [Caldilineales bacterium]
MSPRLSPFLLPLALFLGLALYQLALPGPNYDEAVEAKAAVQLLGGQPVEAHRQAVARVGGRSLPLMIVDYVGALNTYALLALFKLGGVSVITLRLWPVAVAAAILWLTYRLAQALAGPRAALLAALILAVHPSFLFFARQGIYVTNTTIAFMLAILLALWRLAGDGRLRWWYGAAFLAGLGLWAKFIMLWPLAALAILAPLVWWGRRWF